MLSIFKLSMLAGIIGNAAASVTVTKTGKGPTGYMVEFRYVNASVDRVLLGGYPFTDQFHTAVHRSSAWSGWDYMPGDFIVSIGDTLSTDPYAGDLGDGGRWPGYTMERNDTLGEGTWVYKAPYPSGTFSYSFLPGCDFAPNCTTDSGLRVLDPDNMPIQNVIGDQASSTFQVPYDDAFQHYPDMNLNFDYTLPAAEPDRGTFKFVNYTSPGSLHPAPDVHEFGLYLPVEYGTVTGKEYPVVYISHGGAGNSADWINQGRAHHILDNLITEGYMEPTVAVFPSFTNLDDFQANETVSENVTKPDPAHVRENFMQYLFPYVEEHYNVSRDPSRRAFTGLSLGAMMTYEMYINATEYFGYYGLMSGVLRRGRDQSAYINHTMVAEQPALADRGLFIGYGLFDIAFDDCRMFQYALDILKIGYINRVPPWGSHFWNVWQDNLWHFGRLGLWKPTPFNVASGRGMGL